MPETSKENAVAILERAQMKDWLLGTTKVGHEHGIAVVL